MNAFACEQCGADLKFEPGTTALKCPYCAYLNPIPENPSLGVEERDYYTYLNQSLNEKILSEVLTVRCTGCAAETTLAEDVVADECPFCGTALVQTTTSKKWIKPEALLPFQVTRKAAYEAYRNWLGSLWFAPNKLKAAARHEEALNGMYLPHWTYDTQTMTQYTGRRGEYYYETEYITLRDAQGQTRQEARQVQKIRWYPASGTVHNHFDDVLVVATDSLPQAYTENLSPWDLPQLLPYQDSYLRGFRTESYHIGLAEGFEVAKRQIHPLIEASICRDIGGDVQDLNHAQTQYQNITFKHILLPTWLSAYRYSGRVYRFMVNGRTGEVAGERPWSWVKIALAILLCLLILTMVIGLSNQPR